MHDVYETIATHWDKTRYQPWPRVVDFIHSLPPHAIIADIGCGNGMSFIQHVLCAYKQSQASTSAWVAHGGW